MAGAHRATGRNPKGEDMNRKADPNNEWPIIHPCGTWEWFFSRKTAEAVMDRRADYRSIGCRVATAAEVRGGQA